MISSIQLIGVDVDGTLTDGQIHYDSAGNEHKAFHVADGLGIVMAQAAGLKIAIISGRHSPLVDRRMAELGVSDIYQGIGDKAAVLRELMTRYRIVPAQTAFIGDDVNDLPAFAAAGFKFAVADAADILRAQADYVTKRAGGHGAVREAIEVILRREDRLDEAISLYLARSAAKDAARQ